MLLADTYPDDIRVRKEAEALLAGGHRVTLLCSGRDGQPARETVAGIDIVRVGSDGGPVSTLVRAGDVACNLLTVIRPRWVRTLDELLDESDVDALHVHDLPLVRTAFVARRRHGVRVVADLHENFPEAVRQWRRPYSTVDTLKRPGLLVGRLCRPIRRLKRLEKRCVTRADHVVTVVEEAREHYLVDCGAIAKHVTVVGNTVERAAFADAEADSKIVADLPDDAFVVTYVGGFGAHRGLDATVEAVAAMDESTNVHLLLVGSGGGPYEERLRALARKYGVDDRVTFTGWVDFERVPGVVAASDVCLVPHASTPHTETTVPHKLFQYMATGTPVVTSDVAPLARIVSKTDAGRTFAAGDGASLGVVLSELARNPEACRRLGENGRRAVETTYNWERDGERLCRMYERLCE
ncbi:hypothetical protein AUR64_16650 [Haloprofundus marisrubri]|uniref:Glycosyltransferase subfamily 4-like N-terminal domain-containing protein n=2 Tax=Haloprofundus marisrubri TaxID=1514971 RepID=A0A0W1R938_9EURY|nr:hypothetical protein AUR64_16650 [Haloprofundus marisrubri]